MRFLLLLLSAGLLAGADFPLVTDETAWITKTFNTAGVAPSDAATFRAGRCGEVACLSVGPWLAGTSSARYDYKTKLPVTTGTVRGRYRTIALYPLQAMVRVQFFAGEKSLATRTYPLALSAAWNQFSFPVFRSPTGADSISVGFGLSEKTRGHVEFTALSVTTDFIAPVFPAKHSQLMRPRAPKSLPPFRYARLVEHNGAWWLVTAEGKPFFSTGSLTPTPANLPDAAARIRQIGFNSLAGSHNLNGWAEYNDTQIADGRGAIIQFRTLETRVGVGYDTLVDAAGNNPGNSQQQAAAIGGFNHAFPDPFDPKWEEALRAKVKPIAERVRNKPYYAAWFADNEREHRDLHRYMYSPNCARELRRFLETKYFSIAALNKAWSSSYASFDELLAKKPDPVLRKGPMFDDFHAFSRVVLRRFNDIVLKTIREADPGRLVFSNRFMLGERQDVLDNIDLYDGFDALAVNIYPANTSPGLDPAERQFLDLLYAKSKKPIIIGEWSVPALDSGHYDDPKKLDWSYPQTVETQAQRARQSAQFLADLFNLPYIVGAHWFTWTDYDSTTRRANRGLYKTSGEPWIELQNALREVHKNIAAH